MAVYLVTWDLNREGGLYKPTSDALHSTLDTFTTIKDSKLDSVRFVETSLTPTELRDRLRVAALDDNDRIFVVPITGTNGVNYAGWLNTEVWEWIEPRT